MIDHHKLGRSSKKKGSRGELEFAHLCQSHGYDVHRTAQFRGNTGCAGDCEGLEGIHIEVKRVEKLNLENAMNQSIHDAEAENKGNFPIVAHRKNKGEWLITMRAEDWFQLFGKAEQLRREENGKE